MAHRAFSEILLHITWHTERNARAITPDIEERLYRYLRHRIAETPGAFLFEVGGVEEHIHLAVRVPPTITVSTWIGQLKGSSSHYINHHSRPASTPAGIEKKAVETAWTMVARHF